MSTAALKAAATGTPASITAAAIAAGKDVKPKDMVKHLLEQNKQIIAQALPKHMNPERLMRVAITSVTSNPKLLECYVPTLIGGIIQCSQMGLEPNTVLGHAYLIPFHNTKKNRSDAQVVIGYKGLIDLARRSGQITSIAAHAVRQNDTFEYEYGLTEKLRHVPAEGDRGEITHFYAVAHMKDGGHAFEVMTVQAVRKIQQASQGKKNPVWADHFEEMGRKTAIRRLAKYLPLSVELATAVAMEDTTARGEAQNLDGVLTGEFHVEPGEETTAAGDDDDATQQIGAGSEGGAPVIDRPRIAAMIVGAKNTDDLDQALDLLGSSNLDGKTQDELRDEIAKARAKLQGAK